MIIRSVSLFGLRSFVGRGLRLFLSRFIGGADVHRRHLPAAILLEVVDDALVLAQAAHTRALDRADVDESVVSAPIRRDEAVALVLVEEFHRSGGHVIFPSSAAPNVRGASC